MIESLGAIRRFLHLVKVAVVAALLLALAALAWDAHAQTPCPSGAVANDATRVCWRNATEFVDGSAIPATGPTALSHSEVAKGACTATGTPATWELLRVTADVGYMLFEAQPAGWLCFRARHELADGTKGNWTAWVRKELTAPPPPKPRAPSVTIE